ncbi:hypothetical protein [Kitasatospora sp. DSM 101779]|uniref:hypothetical protein n=1 Tax=Kitasatospora sp. DSM 101779 TaxID=2853165 RepID=UPI0021D855AF|nr:hypothetical protein [Kitasatospora sp. DSM 101779]MCU7823915.1 hypothetical protein [Kitasatospora sp. DSM 101779]
MFLAAPIRTAVTSLGAFALALIAAAPAGAATAAPTTPTDLFNSSRHCSTDAASPVHLGATGGIGLGAVPHVTDSAGVPRVTTQFRIWPVADPAQVTVLSDTLAIPDWERSVVVPATALADGGTYAWQAQTAYGGQSSDWSAACYLTVDSTPPSKAPAVTSPNYPQGQWDRPGAPVRFNLDANGVEDVAGFVVSWQSTFPVPVTDIGGHGIPQPVDPYTAYPSTYVRADRLGGSASVELVPPTASGPMTFYVASLDRAFNRSPSAEYAFYVLSAAPEIKPVVAPKFDHPTPFRITPAADLQAVSPVVEYSVTVQGGQDDRTIKVPAKEDGTAEITLRLTGTTANFLHVTATSANGWVSNEGVWSAAIDTTPTVKSDVYPENGSGGGAGVSGTFTFLPKVKGVVSYTYSVNWGEPVTVDADGKGRATVHWVPDHSDTYVLEVWATTRDGLVLAPYDYYFTVN